MYIYIYISTYDMFHIRIPFGPTVTMDSDPWMLSCFQFVLMMCYCLFDYCISIFGFGGNHNCELQRINKWWAKYYKQTLNRINTYTNTHKYTKKTAHIFMAAYTHTYKYIRPIYLHINLTYIIHTHAYINLYTYVYIYKYTYKIHIYI